MGFCVGEHNSYVAEVAYAPGWTDTEQVISSTLWPSNPSLGTLGAVYSSVMRSISRDTTTVTLSDVSPLCQTGNCTWAPYTSLGVCASVADVTSHLTTTYDSSAAQWTSSLPGGQYIEVKSDTGSDSNHEIVMNMTSTNFTPLTSINGTDTITLASDPLSFPRSIAFVGLQNPLAHAAIIYSVSGLQNISVESKTGLRAFEVMLQWCVQTYDTAVTSGATLTNLTGQPYQYSNFSWQLPDDDHVPNATWNGLIQKKNFYPLSAVSLNGSGSEFVIEANSHWGLQRTFSQLFTREYHYSANDETETLAYDNPLAKTIFDAVVLRLNLNTDGESEGILDEILQNLATSITN